MNDEKNDTVPVSPDEPAANQAQPPAPPKLERLQLPLGAFMAFRKSGGAPFSSREIVIYPDGRVSYGGPDLSKEVYARVGRKLNDAQIARLRKMLNQAGFFRLASVQGKPPADAYAYEIVARLSNRSNLIQVFDGNIPTALEPLVQQLNALMPKE